MNLSFIGMFEGEQVTRIDVCESDVIDAAVSLWIDSGRTRDTLLHLTTPYGETYHVLASRITSWFISTEATRRAYYEHKAALDAEEPEWKQS